MKRDFVATQQKVFPKNRFLGYYIKILQQLTVSGSSVRSFLRWAMTVFSECLP